MGPHFVNRGLWRRAFAKSRTHSSAGERSLHTGEVQGSIPWASTILKGFLAKPWSKDPGEFRVSRPFSIFGVTTGEHLASQPCFACNVSALPPHWFHRMATGESDVHQISWIAIFLVCFQTGKE